MQHSTPRRIAIWSTRGFVVSFAAQVTILVAWLWHPGVGGYDHPTIIMLYGLAMTAAIVSGLAAILARCHLAIGQAFAAGMATGRRPQGAQPPAPRRSVPALRAVE